MKVFELVHAPWSEVMHVTLWSNEIYLQLNLDLERLYDCLTLKGHLLVLERSPTTVKFMFPNRQVIITVTVEMCISKIL